MLTLQAMDLCRQSICCLAWEQGNGSQACPWLGGSIYAQHRSGAGGGGRSSPPPPCRHGHNRALVLGPHCYPALASMQLGHRHGKSSIPSGRLLHAMMVLSGGDVAEALLNHIQQAARHRQVRGSCACSMDPAMILRMP
jgi:hypothetical protein